MSKNTSPQSRSSSGPRNSTRSRGRARSSSPSAARVAKTVGNGAKERRSNGPVTWRSRLRRMFFVVAVPNLVAFFSLVAIALATVLLTSSPMAWLPTAIAQSWMVTNLAPVVASDIVVSALPILPALILGWLVAANVHRAVKDKVSVNDLLALLACVVVIPIVLIFVAWFMLWDASQVYEVSPPPLAQAIIRAVALHLTAFAIGMGPRLWRALARRYKVPRVVVDGVVHAVLALLALLAASAFVLLVALIVNWKNQAAILDGFPQLTGFALFALIGLSVLYLPNLLIGVAGILLGAEFHIGDASVSLFSVHLVPLPPLPLLGAVPGSASSWAIGLLLLTAVAFAFVALRQRPSFVQSLVAGVAMGVLVLLFGYFITGELGYYESVGPMLFIAAGLAVVWGCGINLAVATGIMLKERRDNEPDESAVEESSSASVSSQDAPEGEDGQEHETSEEAELGPSANEDYIDGEFEENPDDAAEEQDTTEDSEPQDSTSLEEDSAEAEPEETDVPDEDRTTIDAEDGQSSENLDQVGAESEYADESSDINEEATELEESEEPEAEVIDAADPQTDSTDTVEQQPQDKKEENGEETGKSQKSSDD